MTLDHFFYISEHGDQPFRPKFDRPFWPEFAIRIGHFQFLSANGRWLTPI